MTASPEDLAKWLGKDAGTKEPVHIAFFVHLAQGQRTREGRIDVVRYDAT